MRALPTNALMRPAIYGMIQQYSFGQSLEVDDFHLVAILALDHPDWRMILEGEIVGGMVDADPVYNPRGANNKRAIYLFRPNGDGVPINLEVCLAGGITRGHKVQAFRSAVAPSIQRWKDRQFQAKGGRGASMSCPINGSPIRWNSCEVHHRDPGFAQILNDYLDERGNDLDQISIRESGPTSFCLASRALATDWAVYHDSRADLQLLSVDGHRQVTKERKTVK